MSKKIIPNKLEPLTYHLLDNYNHKLKCEGCNKTWTSDKTAFMRDQGGTSSGKYYRQFRCKGKSKGNCSTAYSHEDFLSLATHQLGQNTIEEIKRKINFNPVNTPISSGIKRQHDPLPTGFSPKSKRFQSQSFSSRTLDNQEFSLTSSDSLAMAQMQLRIEKAESMNDILVERIKQKDELISTLKERIDLLQEKQTHSHSPIPSTPSFSPVSTKSPTVGNFSVESPIVPSTPENYFTIPQVSISPSPSGKSTSNKSDPVERFNQTFSDSPRTYSEAIHSPVKSPTQILHRIPIKSVPDSRAKLQKKHQLTLVYLLGLQYKRVGEFRNAAKTLGLSLYGIQNISFIGSSIVELLVDTPSAQSFIDKAKAVGFKVNIDLNITEKNKENPVWLEYNRPGLSLSDTIKSNFLRRISHEIKTVNNERVRQYYLDWAKSIGWEGGLLLSTLSMSL